MFEAARNLLPDLVKHLGARVTAGLAAFGGAIWLVAERDPSEVTAAAALLGGSAVAASAIIGRTVTDMKGKSLPQPEVTDDSAKGE